MNGERHVLVIANETVAGRSLIEAIERRRKDGPVRVTVITPVNQPREGYVVYEDTRRAAAGRRLEKTLEALRSAGIPAAGLVVETDPVAATRDAIATLEPPPDEIVVSTHPQQRSGWLRKDVVQRIKGAAGGLPVEHVVVDLEHEDGGEANVLVVANETVVGEPLLDKIRERAADALGGDRDERQDKFVSWTKSQSERPARREPVAWRPPGRRCSSRTAATAATPSSRPAPTGTVGPDLDKLPDFARRAGKPLEQFIHESIVNPDAYVEPGYPKGVMPSTFASLPAAQVDALVKYLEGSK